MTTLPTNWTAAPIRELMQPLQDGKLVHQGWSPQCESGPALTASDWGALKTTAIQDGSYQPEHNKRLPEALDAKERLEVKVGDLLMTCAGPRVRCGVACLVRETPPKRFISGKMYRFRANEALIDSRLLEAFLRTPSTKAQIDAMKTGISESGMNITHEKFSQLIVPIAPLSEQKRIADKLDTVLTRVDAVNSRLARVGPLLKRFRQSVLAAATSGRLTEDWRGAGTVEAQKEIKLGDENWKIPSAWHVTELSQAIDPSRPLCYGVVQPGEVREGGVPLIRVQDMENGAVLVNELRTVATEIDNDFRRSRVQPGDILVSVVGTIGRTAIVPDGFEGNIARAIARVSCKQEVNPRWLSYWLNSPSVQWWLVSSSKEVARKTLNLGDLASLVCPVPQEAEQTEIVRRVETLFAFADRLEARLAQAQTAATRLTPALLAKAFRGELVPQDPNDEPAAELLRRLQAQRATAAPASKAGAGRGRGRKAVLAADL